MRDAPLPVVARVLRGGRIESQHRGAVAVVDEAGRLVAFQGDPELPVYLRSTAKPFQAMPLLAAGGERAFRLGDDEIALLCASHGGEPRHVRVALRMLARGGFRASDLECGADLPMDPASARALVRRGERPSALHNNCSGQHAGLLLACRLLGYPVPRIRRPGPSPAGGDPAPRRGRDLDGRVGDRNRRRRLQHPRVPAPAVGTRARISRPREPRRERKPRTEAAETNRPPIRRRDPEPHLERRCARAPRWSPGGPASRRT